MEPRSTDELMQIAGAGGGFVFNVGPRSVDELARIATSAKTGGCMVHMRGIRGLSTQQIIQIATAGSGHVVFES